MAKTSKVAFLGLGTMGYPMAGHLASADHQVRVYNRTAQKAERWAAEYGGTAAATPAVAAAEAELVFACVGADEDLEAVTIGPEGAFAAMNPGALFVDHTTASAGVARKLADLGARQGLQFLDAPVSGGQAGAERGELTIMCGGSRAAFDQALPLLNCYARSAVLMGETGTGQLTKMVNQICIAGLLQGLSEGLAFADNAQLDVERVFDVIAKGAAQSWQMDHRHRTMLSGEFDFGFAVDWMRKDLGLCFDEAARNGSSLPLTHIVDDYYAQIQANGGSRWDTSSLVTRLPRNRDRRNRAREFAVAAHGSQRYGNEPYVTHLDAVANLAQPYGESAEVIAYLHDVIEDTAVGLEQLEHEFGSFVAHCVSLITDQPGATRTERKARSHNKLEAAKGDECLALVVKTADRLANVTACIDGGQEKLLAQYRDEHPEFRAAAHRDGLCDTLWQELDKLLRG